LLKQGLSRSVRVGPDGRVVKRFHRRPLSLGRDRARAEREYEVLRALDAAGLPVPRPLELRAGEDGAYEVVMEWLDGAASLQSILDGETRWPIEPERLARALGRLLAALHGLGLEHPDLHAGNVLVLPDGELRAIDFHKARLGEGLDAAALESDLVQLAAGTREFVGPRFRARFLIEWYRAVAREDLPPRGELARRVEAAARPHRLAVVHRRRRRWTRAGTACRELEGLNEGFVRVGVEPARVTTIGRDRSGVLVIERLTWRDARRAWYAAARLYEHRVPCAPPLCLVRRPAPWLALELPAGGRPMVTGETGLAPLAAQLIDRGLDLSELRPEHLWVDGRGRPFVAGLPALGPSPSATPPAWLAELARGSRG
jgi:tRNA A-37 threonylcarbamoyl transferase component Bud32